jgi:hypothetical protein
VTLKFQRVEAGQFDEVSSLYAVRGQVHQRAPRGTLRVGAIRCRSWGGDGTFKALIHRDVLDGDNLPASQTDANALTGRRAPGSSSS